MPNIKRNNNTGRFIKTPTLTRFKQTYEVISNGCWEWKKYRDKDGYGQFSITGNPGTSQPAHRASWLLFKGAIPRGLNVLHKCDNPPCVNPKHLFLGTIADNNQDRDLKGRNIRGEKVNTNILSKKDVIKIRASKIKNRYILADKYGVSYATISDVINYRSWKWL